MTHKPTIEVRDFMLQPLGEYSLYSLNRIGIYLGEFEWGVATKHGLRLYPTEEFYLWLDDIDNSFRYTYHGEGATDKQIGEKIGLSMQMVNKVRKKALEKLEKAFLHRKPQDAANKGKGDSVLISGLH